MLKKTVLITGASKGIGAQIARKFASNGYNVCINYNNSEKEALDLKEELLTYNVDVDVYKADVSNLDQVKNLVLFTLKRFGNIDVLVNNAGICEYKLFLDVNLDDINKMMDVLIKGTFFVTQEVIKKCMLNNKSGSIINISSVWGMVGASMEVNYSMCKAAIIGFSKALAKEMAPSNIRVNVVAPGVIDTDMIKNLNKDEINSLKEEIPLERIGTCDDVANSVYFLASKESSYITGQVLSPNGGFVI